MTTIKNSAQALEHIIHRHFIWVIIASYGVAAIVPGFGLWIRDAELGSVTLFQNKLTFPLPLMMLASLLFNAGLGVRAKELAQLRHQPFMLVGGLVVNSATPLLFIIVLSFVSKPWHNPAEMQQILVGLALVAAMPIAGASTAWAQNANGNLALSLGLVLFTTLLSPLITPFVLHTIGFVTFGDYSDDLHELASNGVATFLGLWVILPSLLGILTHWLIGEHRIASVKPYLKLINYTVLVLLNYSNASLTLPNAVSQPDFDFFAIILAIVIVLCVITFFSGYLVARLFRVVRNETVSLMFGLGMKNNGTGLVLASMALSDHPQIMLPIILYNLVQHLIASVVDFTLFQRQPAQN
ncbi:MAG: bile acid:sodium symporter [Methylococcales bacterium]|nr:bile acid:sodium symporter [Methylococcales bacterium]